MAVLMASIFASAIKDLEGSVTRPESEAPVDWARRTGVDESRRSSRRAETLRMFLNLSARTFRGVWSGVV